MIAVVCEIYCNGAMQTTMNYGTRAFVYKVTIHYH